MLQVETFSYEIAVKVLWIGSAVTFLSVGLSEG